VKRFFPSLVLFFSVIWLASSWLSPQIRPGEIDLAAFGKIPVLVGGRVQPLDTVARNALLIIRSNQRLQLPNGAHILAMRWLTDTLFNAAVADQYPAFVINNSEVLGLFGWQQEDRKYFSFAELSPFLKQIDEQGEQSEKLQSAERSAFQSAVLNLRNALVLYQRLENSLQPEAAHDFTKELDSYANGLPLGLTAARQREEGQNFAAEKLDAVAQLIQRYEKIAEMAYILAVPPLPMSPGPPQEWRSAGQSLVQSIATREIHPVVKMYARIGDAYRAGDEPMFNQQVNALAGWMAKEEPRASSRASYEFLFNRLQPFSQAMVFYVLAFLLACASWLGWSRTLSRSAFYLLLLTLAVHTFGMFSRMYLQERPPVTNLYSSAIFIGWVAVIAALILERIFRDGIGAACASAVGFITLVIAHHLAGSGDTLEMLQAVLDTNIWLATHVVAITTGYSAMFLAGMLAIIYVVRGVFTRSLTRSTAAGLTRMTYGVVCFATLFSFVGTVLGGIWADQSWGRFWGWDPKENGAVLIVLWCAIILHARWGGYIRQRGLMIMAIFGNVITSFSWFGVNMLGVGLHSYGFMQKAFPWLVGFIVSQLVLMAVAALPLGHWRSFALSSNPGGGTGKAAGRPIVPAGGATLVHD
jgi:ABC-type transport system involved in cytochrome c biogenesis permease subunit